MTGRFRGYAGRRARPLGGIMHVRMLLAWIWVLASRSSKAESRRA